MAFTPSSSIDALLGLANPSAVSFLHVNASNVPTFMSAANFRTALGVGTGDSPTFTGATLSALTSSAALTITSGSGNININPVGYCAISTASGLYLFSNTPLTWNADVYLYRAAANTLYQRNSTAAQNFWLANTYTDASNYERAVFGYTSNVLRIGTENAGTGSARAIDFVVGGTVRLGIGTTGDVTLTSGASVKFGGASYNIYGTSANTSINAPNAFGQISFDINGVGKWFIEYSGRLCAGGTTSSFPALKRSATTLQARLADDSDFAAVQSLYQRFGSGTPEAAVTAPVGATYHRTDGGAGTSFYVKESGTGNTGWTAK